MTDIKGIIIDSESSILEKYKNILNKAFDITIFNNDNDAVSYIVNNNTEIMFFITTYNKYNKDNVVLLAHKIKSINPQISHIIVEAENKLDIKGFDSSLIITKDFDEVKIINNIKEYVSNGIDYKRKYSRVNWPLNVIVEFTDKSYEPINRSILSISGNGAYICSDTHIPKKGSLLNLTISFKDFKLFTEAKVVLDNSNGIRPNVPSGFAVEFINIGPSSQKIIDQIIKDKLLREILIDYNDEQFS